jgi:hypothetical protein
MMGLPAGWVTDVPGLTRNQMLKALGNGVVPQQAEAALRWLLDQEAGGVATSGALLPTPVSGDAGSARANKRGNLTLKGTFEGLRESDRARLLPDGAA